MYITPDWSLVLGDWEGLKGEDLRAEETSRIKKSRDRDNTDVEFLQFLRSKRCRSIPQIDPRCVSRVNISSRTISAISPLITVKM